MPCYFRQQSGMQPCSSHQLFTVIMCLRCYPFQVVANAEVIGTGVHFNTGAWWGSQVPGLP